MMSGLSAFEYVLSRCHEAAASGISLLLLVSIIVFGLIFYSASASDGEAIDMGKQYVPIGYELVWSDEFDGTELDGSKWMHRGVGKRNGGVISTDATFVDGAGHLVIETRKVGSEYHSGMVSTQRSSQFKYGYFEARMKFPIGMGQTSAFWLQSRGNTSAAGPPDSAGLEIDIIEFYRGRLGGWAANALHWGGYGDDHQVKIHRRHFADADDWHTFGLLWTESGYTFFADGKKTWQTGESVSHVAEYIILSTLIAHRSELLERADLPDRFLVDYVRVYGAGDSIVQGNQSP